MLHSLGYSTEVIEWFRLYLLSKKFHVDVHGKFSTTAERCGVPPESIL